VTLAEIAAMPWFADLHPSDNIGWRGVSHTQLSLARHHGGIKVNGRLYVYVPQADELIRHDILQRALKYQRNLAAAADESQSPVQTRLI